MNFFKENPIPFMYKLLWKYSKGRRKFVVLYLVLFFFANATLFFEPLVFAKLLDTIQTQGLTPENFWFILGLISLFFIIMFVFWIFHGIARNLEISNAFLVRANYRKYLINGVLSLPAQYHNKHHYGDIMDKIEKACQSIFNFSQTTFIIFGAVLNLIISFLAILYLNTIAGALILTVIICGMTIIHFFDIKLRPRYKTILDYDAKTSERVYDTFSNISTVLILKLEKLLFKDIVKIILHPYQFFKKTTIINELKWFSVSMFSSISIVLVLGSYIIRQYYFVHEIILIGTISALYMYTTKINSVFSTFAANYETFVRHKTAIENVSIITKHFVNRKQNKKIFLQKDWKTIEINNLNFHYEKHDKSELNKIPDLKNIKFSCNKGEKIAIIGESGSGKSTFLKILSGLYKPSSIDIKIDSASDQFAFKKISNSSILVPQEPEIFATTIKENITFGLDIPLQKIKKYTNLATFTPILAMFPQKWNTKLSGKGTNLSGGQKQRLALSRALLAAKKKRIILLDESTSSVDSVNEHRIYQNILTYYKKKTIIATIHKLHLLEYFDRIVVFENGKIIANGTLQELYKTSKEFKKIYDNYTRSNNKCDIKDKEI